MKAAVAERRLEPLTYWRGRGRTYERDFRPERYREQEAALETLLGRLDFSSVLDVGCGFGRVGEMVYRLRPDLETYVGVDISPEQLAAARRRVPRGTVVLGDIRSLRQRSRFDLVLAVEVLMHVRPADIEAVVGRLCTLARRHLVTVDWDAPHEAAGGYCWGHDYRSLFGPGAERIVVGRQAIWHVAP